MIRMALERSEHRPETSSAERRLAVHVLLLSLRDLRTGRCGAWSWWDQADNPVRDTWVQAAGLDPVEVRKQVLAGAVPPVTRGGHMPRPRKKRTSGRKPGRKRKSPAWPMPYE